LREDEREHSLERENGGFSELIFGSEKEMKIQKTKNTSMLIALLLVLMAGSVGVQADGSDPLDPSDGGADWDGDGLTNAEETAEGTDPTGSSVGGVEWIGSIGLYTDGTSHQH
jgi:hypothetical protein